MSQYKQFISEDEWNESEVNLCRRSRNKLFQKIIMIISHSVFHAMNGPHQFE